MFPLLLTNVAPETVTPLIPTLSVATTENETFCDCDEVVSATLVVLLVNDEIVGATVSVLLIFITKSCVAVLPAASEAANVMVSVKLPKLYELYE